MNTQPNISAHHLNPGVYKHVPYHIGYIKYNMTQRELERIPMSDKDAGICRTFSSCNHNNINIIKPVQYTWGRLDTEFNQRSLQRCSNL